MSQKAQSMMGELRDELAKRFTTVGPVKQDTDGLPYVVIGAATAGSQSAVVKIADVALLGKNAIGQDATNYGAPTVAQVVLETSTIASVPLMTMDNLLTLLSTVTKMGARTQIWLSANTNAVDVGDITGAAAATWDPSLKWKLSGQM